MAARAHNWVNRRSWIVEVESRMMASDAHLGEATLNFEWNQSKLWSSSQDAVLPFQTLEGKH